MNSKQDQILSNFYNLLNSNRIPTQNIKFLSQHIFPPLTNHTILPLPKGRKFFMYINNNNIYLINNTEKLLVKSDQQIKPELENTIIKGYYHEKFIGYDVLIYKGINIRTKSYTYRYKCLQEINTDYPKCNLALIYTKEKIKELLKEHDGVMFIPTRAHYINNQTYIYQLIDKVTLNLQVKSENKMGIPLCSLYLSNKVAFSGTKELPLQPLIPLSHYDRNFIKQQPTTSMFEFAWINNNFVPVKPASYLTSPRDAKRAWEYINDPLEHNVFLKLLYN